MSKVELAWQVYESNVQQYRTFSATLQSFLIAVGAIVAANPSIPSVAVVILLMIIGLIHIWGIWYPIVTVRTAICDYYKYQVFLNFSDEKTKLLEADCDDNKYATDENERARVNEKYFQNRSLTIWRPTRIKLDWWIPLIYSLIWIILLLWVLATLSAKR